MKANFLMMVFIFCLNNHSISQVKVNIPDRYSIALDHIFLSLEPLSGKYFVSKIDADQKDDGTIADRRYQFHLKENFYKEQLLLMEQTITDVENNVKKNNANYGKPNHTKLSFKEDSIFLSKVKPGMDFYVNISFNIPFFFPYGHNTSEAINQLFPIQLPLSAHAFHVFTWDVWTPTQYGIFYFGKHWPIKIPAKTLNANAQPKYPFQSKSSNGQIENIVINITGPKEVTEWFAKNVNWSAITALLNEHK